MTKEQIVSGAIVTLIATFVGWLTNRASNKASVTNVTTSSRVEMEKEAYERARKMDTETITRQDSELKDLEEKYDKMQGRFDTAYENNQKLNDDMARITHDNYQLHRENTRVLELNEQVLAENRRLRNHGEQIIQANHRLREEVAMLRELVATLQQGVDINTADRIRKNGGDIDTSPMMPEVNLGQ